jgi:uncharacterized protein YukE
MTGQEYREEFLRLQQALELVAEALERIGRQVSDLLEDLDEEGA